MIRRATITVSASEAKRAERALLSNPEDIKMRATLLDYYWRSGLRDKATREKRQKAILWIVENRPGSQIAGAPVAALDPRIDGRVYYQARRLWMKQASKFCDNPAVLANAASFFSAYDLNLAERCVKRLRQLEPSNPDWPEELANLRLRRIRVSIDLGSRARERTARGQV
jgi:hypothetical protein